MARGKKGKGGPTPVDSLKHQDRRPNIPTEELRDFVKDKDKNPSKLLYPRDPSLDPQLVWQGKDEQDREDLTVPIVPVFIQEKIHPQALIENLRKTAREGEPEPELSLFDTFNGLEFEELIDFYHHDQNWANRMILGDSLLVMASLAEKEGFKGKVQMLYMDPPYGIKFGSNWQVSTRKRAVQDGKLKEATRQPEQVKAFRDTWEIGVNSYLPYLRDRLAVARDLLTESGSIFLQMGDKNVHRVRCLLDEVFGDENFVSQIQFVTTGGQTQLGPASVTDHLLWYAKNKDSLKYRPLVVAQERKSLSPTISWYTELESGEIRSLARHEVANPDSLPSSARLLWLSDLLSRSGGPSTQFEVSVGSRGFVPSRGGWRTGKDGMTKLQIADRLFVKGNTLLFKRFLDDYPFSELTGLWLDTQMGGFAAKDKVYVVQTHTRVVERCLLMTTDPGDLVLDPTCGSGTTAYVAEQWGRRWTTIDTSRVALALARTRLMAAKYPYYLLADSREGIRKEAEVTSKVPSNVPTQGDPRKGFVYRRVPHVTLKSIANNPDIRDGMSRTEIDAAIARHADTELLFDQPYEDAKRIRVTSPFTVESLSPHRMLSGEQIRPDTEEVAEAEAEAGEFDQLVVEHLRKNRVQTGIKNWTIDFDRLDSYAGEWLQAVGEFRETDGTVRTAAVSIGPKYGTVTREQVKEAAKEAVRGSGHDVLLVCGLAFNPDVSEEAKQYGRLRVLIVRMNPDLALFNQDLKNTGTGNLFMVFGEPDITIEAQPDGQLVAEINGLDIYDPTTGQIRNSSTDEIACWFIDTNYNEESFFVRHAYFTGAGEPYKKLQRALKAEINEEAWASLYSTRSRPFARPETGKIAVKVINHYGDEVLKVYALSG